MSQAVIEERRSDLARWEGLNPPRYLGRAPVAGHSPSAQSEADALTVRGTAASPGVVRGRARVVMALGEAEKVEPGDVLVCPSTSPSWMPLFAIVAAVVTDAGGILSHPAIAAREYAIPCVAGTLRGTQVIPDGAFVTVDGGRGTVLIAG